MQLRHRQLFTSIRTEGAILPADLLQRIDSLDHGLGGLSPEDYHLPAGVKLNEAVNQSWNRIKGAWLAFQTAREKLAPNDTATTITREKWLLPLFQELNYGRLKQTPAVEIEGRGYAVFNISNNVPIHLVGAGVDLDQRTAGVAGAARMSPHGMVQELLNREDAYLWGFVSNGLQLRILRDNVSLTRQAFVEFDLESMMTGEHYSDFTMLWLLCHESRVTAEKPFDFWLEKWSKKAIEIGTRALDQLRNGVEDAIKFLGQGFIAHPANKPLLEKLRSGALDKQDYYRQLLRLVYRLIFLFVAEDRELLFPPEADSSARERYTRFYSLSRLRRLAGKRTGTRHHDLFQGLRLVMAKLSGEEGGAGYPDLALPALGSFLFAAKAIEDINDCEIENGHLLSAIRTLAFLTDQHGLRTVDYRNLRSEELGSIYEALLELHPEINAEAKEFNLSSAGGNERKTTGSYYTPDSLVQCLLDSALDPVVDEAIRAVRYRDREGAGNLAEQAILNLKVCDPACGSGHFLIAAAHRMAKRLAAIRTGDEEPSPAAIRTALRDVIGHCIYGVDINPMAVELCKVSLWMESLEPGRPLTFLEHRIQCGNALIGATPALLEKGIPDEAFKPIEGDDKACCTEYRRQNRQERKDRQRPLIEESIKLGNLAASIAELDAIDDADITGVHAKQQRYEALVKSSGYLYGRFLADAWCAAFVWKKTRELPYPITEAIFREIEHNPYRHATGHDGGWLEREVKRLAAQYQFFHWHLAFPDVFAPGAQAPSRANHGETVDKERNAALTTGAREARALPGWGGGFDVVLGNPPWERIKLQEKEWFAQRNPEIANAPNAATRQRMIKALLETDPALHEAFLDDRRKAEGESHLARNSGRFPLCGTGDINTYAIFAETNRMLINAHGRVGCIVPSGIATDDTTKLFFQSIVEERSLVSLYDFQSGPGLFGEIGHARFKFCLLTLAGKRSPHSAGSEFAFFLRDTAYLNEADRRFTLSAEEIALLNPNTRTCPIFRSKRDAELTKSIYRRVPVLIREGSPGGNSWGIEFKRMIDMANDSGQFRTREDLLAEGWLLSGNIFSKDDGEYLPLYEAKMLHHFDHRFGDYDDKPEDSQNTSLPDIPVERLQNPEYVVQPRYWVPREEVLFKITRVPPDVLKAYRDGDEKGLSAAVLHWLSTWENAQETEEDWEHLNAKERQARRERLARARDFLASYPLTATEYYELRRDWDGLQSHIARLIEAKAPRWLLGWRDITNATNERTVIASVLPSVGVGNNAPLIMLTSSLSPLGDLLIANLSSLIHDFAARFKVGGTHLNFFIINQLPVLPRSTYFQPCLWKSSQTLREWIAPRVLELTYTAYDLRGFAEDSGYAGEPFRWDEARRFMLRCELDAAYFHLYGIAREDVDYILDTFPIVRRKDEAWHGEYRTKRVILEIYDEMQDAMTTGQPYQTRLDPSPANGWTPPEIIPEAVIIEPATQTADAIHKKQSDLFAWQSEDPQQRLKFDDTE
ncbi:MAG: N-6 DNA methylase [Acidobacteriota bacterium]|nr:MAG: N-6 DNA methylase [Acidobacteriota bacterium]